jgi:hypothetical protein
MRLSLKKGAHAAVSRCSVQEIRGISLVFREMWDSTALSPKLSKMFFRQTAADSKEIGRVPHVRNSVRGPKMMGAAQRSLFTAPNPKPYRR